LGENSNEESSEELEEDPEKDIEEEEFEGSKEESKTLEVDNSVDEIEGDIIEELDSNSEDIEEAEITEENGQEQENHLIEEIMDEQKIEDEKIGLDEISESTVIDEKALELDEKVLHRNFIEAALYAAGGPLTVEELSNKLEFPKKEVEILVNELAFNYLERTTSLIIAQIGDRYQMQIRPEYTEKVSKFAKGGAIAERYLRTLTIIALKQPILKSMVVKLRGSGAYEHVKYLLDNQFIDAVKKGRSQELTTTDKYAEMFGLPKDKRLMKEVMVKQLGLEEGGKSAPPAEIEEINQVEPVSEIEQGEHSGPPVEIDEVDEDEHLSKNKEE
jgi:segregation and condensation protein B